MRKDWVVWVGCASLFATGVIWGRVPIATDFFKVKDIHDLFDIAGAGATVIAVIFAALKYDDWKEQMKVQRDYELASRIYPELMRFKVTVENCFLDAQNCVSISQRAQQAEGYFLGDDAVQQLKKRREENITKQAEFEALLKGAEMLWGDWDPKSLAVLFASCENFHDCVMRLVACYANPSLEIRKSYYLKLDIEGEKYKMDGWTDENFSKKIDGLIQPALEQLHKKLLRH
ncbi:MAG: hypothetical protein EOO16_07890 [Chitinophagaceae bacterium]|nr:MAG: hypothetical protein EOO16_07890 [Chitinophagaceae bacterium]